MLDDPLDYRHRVKEALRSVVRQVLDQVARAGLPDKHHFFIGFKTRAQGVRLPPALLKRYPEEMDIILQNQFSNLVVSADSFSVTLSFSGLRHRVTVPFGSLTRFVDPPASFGLQFDEDQDEEIPSETARSFKKPAAAADRHQPATSPSGKGTPGPVMGRVLPFDRPGKT